MVSDINTANACGWTGGSLPTFCHASHHCYTQPPYPDFHTAQALAEQARHYQAVIGVGSGTINDLCKYAAHQAGIPYGIIATAPSMNGYHSPNASLKSAGYKRSFPARTASIVLGDLEVLANAPTRLIASGIGDTLCRTTILRDMWLSHHWLGTSYDKAYLETLQEYEEEMTAALATAPLSSSPATSPVITSLIGALEHSGLAMAKAGSSAPASQAEHMLAHVLETLYPRLSEDFFHGEIIAVTTLEMARLQQRLIPGYNGSRPSLPAFATTEIESLVKKEVADEWRKAYECKVALLAQANPTRLAQATLPSAPDPSQLAQTLTPAGCPVSYSDLGLTSQEMAIAMRIARFTRDRLTWLDMEAPPNAC